MASGETAARRRDGSARPALPSALLTIVARALHLERAAFLLEESPGGDFVPVAEHRVHLRALNPADPPTGGPWSLALPVRSGAGPAGLLLVDRGGGAPLAPPDRLLAEQFGEAAACLAEHGRIAGDLERTRELLAHADRLSALGLLAAGVAHEIRNPLVSVRTFIQLLPERLSDEEFRTGFRDLALDEIERICGLINDLLAFSRPGPGEREATNVNEAVSQILRLLQTEARRRNITITRRAEAEQAPVEVDHAHVKQVLMNVLLNAIQACEPGGSVEITTRTDERGGDAWCVVTVADSGPGIPPEHVAQIFDPFFTTKAAGSGLGLFIAREIVTRHGGYIGTAARERGGTEFSIHFPLCARPGNVDAGAV